MTTKLIFSSGAISNASLNIEYRTQTRKFCYFIEPSSSEEILNQTTLTIRSGNYVLAKDNIEEFSPVVIEAAEAVSALL